MASISMSSRLAPRPRSINTPSLRTAPRLTSLPTPRIASLRLLTRNTTMRSSSSDVPPDMSTTGKASSNEAQLQQQQELADLGEARPGAVPDPDAAAMADSNIGQNAGSSSSSSNAGRRDTGDANSGVTPDTDAAALADSNIGPSEAGSGSGSGQAGAMGVQDRAPATELPSPGPMADRLAQGLADGSSGRPDEKAAPAKGSDPGIARGL